MTITTPNTISEPLGVWLKLDDNGDEVGHEANTYQTETGYVIEWYLNAARLVKAVHFDTLKSAHEWYEREGFQDFSS